MDRVKRLFQPASSYEPIHDNQHEDEEDHESESGTDVDSSTFSWIEYSIFLLLGVAMLWAWNMFLAAAPYFQHRFAPSQWILNHFQAAEISVSTVTNLSSMLLLTKLQKNANYPKRITSSLIISTVVFAILSVSTLIKASPKAYFSFLLIAIFSASLATGLIQNGLFAFTSGFGRSEYTQAIMTGQAVAGVLPPLAQIISVAVVPTKKDGTGTQEESPTSALIYFLTATTISIIALFAFFYLVRRKSNFDSLHSTPKPIADEADALAGSRRLSAPNDSLRPEKASIPLWTLFCKLLFLALGVFLCFAVTMVFPVFTASILSVSGIDSAIFIPLAFLLWNVGDLLGRLITLSPKVSLTHYPFALFAVAMARLLFIPLYFLCNIKGRGATISSDFFYLVIVQFLFGLTNGYLGSLCMMGAVDWVAPEEREAAGGFMGLMLVGGLAVGSLLSFLLGDV
jgi:solute carrier family 29 (equilibrative nucleoside transporter), member 1/2/3